ncbi:MAG: AraC family transcriptional regulator ligand-binding domain-containing protein, partial [Myxococcota bacterium]
MTQANTFAVEPSWNLLFHELGVEPARILRRAGLPDDLLSRSGVRLGTEDYFRLWETFEHEVGDPLLPLRLGELMTAEVLLPPLFAALCSPNLVVALERISTYKRLVGPMALYVDHEPLTL